MEGGNHVPRMAIHAGPGSRRGAHDLNILGGGRAMTSWRLCWLKETDHPAFSWKRLGGKKKGKRGISERSKTYKLHCVKKGMAPTCKTQ